jgi:preprotein translocase subunit SecE
LKDEFKKVAMFKQLWANTREFLTDVSSELKKISYPTHGETIGSTTVVIVLVVIVSIFLALTDLLLVRLMGKII